MEKIQKHAKGYYARRTIKLSQKNTIRFYLNLDGDWVENRLRDDCFFPTKELCQSFLSLRLSLEEWRHKCWQLEYEKALRSIPENATDEQVDQILNDFRRNSYHYRYGDFNE